MLKLETFLDIVDLSLSSDEVTKQFKAYFWKYINHHHVGGADPQNPDFQAANHIQHAKHNLLRYGPEDE